MLCTAALLPTTIAHTLLRFCRDNAFAKSNPKSNHSHQVSVARSFCRTHTIHSFGKNERGSFCRKKVSGSQRENGNATVNHTPIKSQWRESLYCIDSPPLFPRARVLTLSAIFRSHSPPPWRIITRKIRAISAFCPAA